ncbi:copper-containing nitrite reductase [Brucella sp. BE17]|uniref:copper-containing nitrite reductase n=1 Tax=Brucella sp. BE17 TaxID=3142977 RepID=UPI0031BA4744
MVDKLNVDALPDVAFDKDSKLTRRKVLIGSAGLAAASATFAATPALAQHDHSAATAKGMTSPSGSLSNRVYAVVDGVTDIARKPTDIPPPITRRQPETVTVELETIELEARLDGRTTYRYWTFNGTVPGPFVRVRVGDTVKVSLKNDESSTMMHNVDFHAVTGPGGGAEATTAAPGETKRFTFKAMNPGLYVYHCAVPPVAMHISSGMYGMILVEPEDGLPEVDHEFYVMQGEIYTEEEFGSSGLLTESYEKLLNERPEYFVLNGHVGALTDHYPMKAKVGETVRIYFGVGGPNFQSSFHVIGEIFDRVYQFGSLTSPPLTDVQTVTVPAGGATAVEFKVEVPGKYVLVDHALSRVERGLAGFLIVEGDENPDIFKVDEE